MKTQLTCGVIASAIALAFSIGSVQAQNYDFFRNIRYPGQQRPDVGLDRIEQEGGPDAAGDYHKRVVHWWPKQGVDIVEVPEGAPLRTWTIRTGDVEPLVAVGRYAKWWPQTLRGKTEFKAHFLGFRGIGSVLGNPFMEPLLQRVEGPGMVPAVVLLLEDGRKRTFTRGAFVDEDQAYILQVYEAEMARIRDSLESPPAKLRPGIEETWPDGEIYKPGTFRVEGDYIVICAGSQSPEGEFTPWVDPELKEETAQYRAATLRHFEDFWVYNEYAGRLMPYWEREEQYKYLVTVPGTMRDGSGMIPGFAGGGYGACEIKGAAWGSFYHEWGHGQARNGMILMGGGETHCDAHQTIGDPSMLKVSHQIERPWKNLFHGQYPGALAYTMMGDDPNWGYAAAGTFTSLMTMEEHTPMHTIARLGEERGIWENGIKGMGDFMGQIGARYAEYDTELETGLREVFPAPNRAILVALDREKGLYRSTVTEAPEPFGVNLIRLEAEPGAGKISVDFQGHFDAATHSDWRACIVAVDKDGRSRYSPLWNKGVMEMETRPGDQRYWLTVTATPYALTSPQPNGERTIQHVYQGAFTYRYPYDVTLRGCRPATPNASFAFNENWGLNRDPVWPVPSDSPEYSAVRKQLETAIERVPAVLAAIEEVDLSLYITDHHLNQRNRAIREANAVKRRAEWLLENAQGARHPNGGGWVAATAEVAPTAFVGPDCMVLDGAKVLDHAAIEDYAIVSGSVVVVKDHAKVRGKAVVTGNVTVSGFARVSRNLSGDTGQRTGVEQRQLFEVLNPVLYANYAFDRPETVLMEDTFVEHSYGDFASGSHLETLIFFDGRLYGEPGFLADGGVRAITFNGENQYAEADPAVADLGEITVDMAFRWDGGAATLLDFGSSADDRFMLMIAGNGEMALSLTSSGEREKLTAGKPIVSGEWTRCRIEMDGSTASLWINGQIAASIRTDYRAADAFKPGREMRNFVAASRESEDFFSGAMEYLRIYHAVVDDFSQVGEPLMISSRRKTGLQRNADEYKALVGFTGWQERQYTRPPPVERLKQRTLSFMPECRTQLYEAFPIQKSEWHTTVEWDGRLEWEKADEPLSPIMVRWIQRMKPYASHAGDGDDQVGEDAGITLTRELVIDKPYLHLPFDGDAPVRSMRIYDGDQVVRRSRWQLAEGEPDYWHYTEVRDYMGRTLRFEVDEMMPNSTALEALILSDRVPGQVEDLYKEAYRPQFHFTAARGWLNDPNGMVYYDGEYHLFFQHNPYSVNWGNMTWGHAVSEDMIHWRQKDAVIHPDELGTIFSGGGVVDFDNTTGWATDDHVPIIAFYTSAGQPFTQSMAYSTDRGRTMIKYENNPIIGNIHGSNRDPNVFWHEPSGQWIMSLWISADRFDLFGSSNMREWTQLSELTFPGGYECPDMFELPVDGDPDNTRWVFWEGAGKYLIGDFDGKVFEPGSEVLHSTFGSNDYAAQTFTNMPDGDDRVVQISWMRRGRFPGMPFNQQMTLPRKLSLRTTSEGIRIFIEPVEEVKTLRQAKHQWTGLKVGDDDITLDGVDGDLFDIEIEFDLGNSQAVGITIRDQKVEYTVGDEQLTSLGDTARLPADNNRLRLRILVDRTSVEVFANEGRVQIATSVVPDENKRDIEVYATGGQAEVISLNVWELRSIYEQVEPFQ